MTNFNGEILTITALFTGATQDGYGVITNTTFTNLSIDGYGQVVIKPSQLAGIPDGYAQPRLTALAGASINPIPHWKLSCEDNTGLRHYWVDVAISLTRAPAGFTYVTSTFVVEGRF